MAISIDFIMQNGDLTTKNGEFHQKTGEISARNDDLSQWWLSFEKLGWQMVGQKVHLEP